MSLVLRDLMGKNDPEMAVIAVRPVSAWRFYLPAGVQFGGEGLIHDQLR